MKHILVKRRPVKLAGVVVARNTPKLTAGEWVPREFWRRLTRGKVGTVSVPASATFSSLKSPPSELKSEKLAVGVHYQTLTFIQDFDSWTQELVQGARGYHYEAVSLNLKNAREVCSLLGDV